METASNVNVHVWLLSSGYLPDKETKGYHWKDENTKKKDEQ